jgi:hypothetical protein
MRTIIVLLTSVLLALALAACQQAPPSGGSAIKASGGSNYNSVLVTTGSTSSNGVAVAGRHTVRSVSLTNLTGTNAWATLQDQTTVPDAGFSTMVGAPIFLPANVQVILGTDFFGTDGWNFATGVSVGVTTTGSSDAGGVFTAAGSACCDITLNGS